MIPTTSTDKVFSNGAGCPTGSATMSPAMKTADRYARYLYDCVRPWLRGPVLEVGIGYGTYTPLLLQHGHVVGLDIEEEMVEAARRRFGAAAATFVRLDLNNHAAVRALKPFKSQSAFCSNVLEHLHDDVGALRALYDALVAGGRLCLIVPGHPGLYGYMDSQAGHFRRYTKQTLGRALTEAGWQIEKLFYINALAGLGWWINNRLCRPKRLDAPVVNGQLALYDRFLVPLARLTDPLFRRCFGLSVVGIGRKVPLAA